MCLISDTNKPFIAIKDIICYKAVRRVNQGIGYKTPVVGAIIEDNIFVAKESPHIRTIHKEEHLIDIGFIHSHIDELQAKCSPYNYDVILKCLIPEGTEYFINNRQTEYASKKIIILEEI